MQLAKLIADNVAQGRRLAEDLGESGCLSAVSEKAEISKEFLRGVLKFNKSLRAVQVFTE